MDARIWVLHSLFLHSKSLKSAVYFTRMARPKVKCSGAARGCRCPAHAGEAAAVRGCDNVPPQSPPATLGPSVPSEAAAHPVPGRGAGSGPRTGVAGAHEVQPVSPTCPPPHTGVVGGRACRCRGEPGGRWRLHCIGEHDFWGSERRRRRRRGRGQQDGQSIHPPPAQDPPAPPGQGSPSPPAPRGGGGQASRHLREDVRRGVQVDLLVPERVNLCLTVTPSPRAGDTPPAPGGVSSRDHTGPQTLAPCLSPLPLRPGSHPCPTPTSHGGWALNSQSSAKLPEEISSNSPALAWPLLLFTDTRSCFGRKKSSWQKRCGPRWTPRPARRRSEP